MDNKEKDFGVHNYFYAPIGQYITHSTVHFHKEDEFTEMEEVKEPGIPEQLQTGEAKELLGKFINSRLLTEDLQPIDLSKPEQALLAKFISEKLEINDVWQVFGELWKMKTETLRTYFNRALEQRKSLKFQDKIKNIVD
ncbi:MAG: hypothetical protein IJ190_03340 [Prevotella sp.]|nr:hypothetical protein [Prevotella sp.]